MSQYIIRGLASPLLKPVGSPGKVSPALIHILLQQVVQPQNSRWNPLTCRYRSASQVSQTDKRPPSHVTTHLLLMLNGCLEAPSCGIVRLFAQTVKRLCGNVGQIPRYWPTSSDCLVRDLAEEVTRGRSCLLEDCWLSISIQAVIVQDGPLLFRWWNDD